MAPKGQRVVAKIGTNTLASGGSGPDPAYLAAMAKQVADLRAEGHEVLIVSSGAIGSGKAILGERGHVRDVTLRQAYAAVGQARLMRAWEEAFAPHKIVVAQLLLTHHTFTSRRSFLNLRNATERLLEMGVVPIINENDTVSIDEIGASFGDNDKLSAMVAAKVGADLLVILSDVAGLYTRPPGKPGAMLLPVVEDIRAEHYDMVSGKAGSGSGSGGMGSKLDAAKIAMRAGIPVVIASGRENGILARLLAGEAVGTRFLAHGKDSDKGGWLKMARAAGRVHVDRGAADALARGKHLLPAGVTGVEGTFPAESVIEILHEGRALAKAITELSSKELEAARGRRSEDLARLLARAGPFNVTRKKKLVLLEGPDA